MPLRFLEPVDCGDVSVIERRQELCFAAEPRQPLRVGYDCVWQDLERHVAAQPGIARAIDLPHAARTDERDGLVRAKDCSGGSISTRA